VAEVPVTLAEASTQVKSTRLSTQRACMSMQGETLE
jgi:hypothetical protein